MKPFPFLFPVLLLLLGGPVVATEVPRSVLFIAIDDLRSDFGAVGAGAARTPHLDAFSRTARVFSHHYVQVPTCGASRCALLRGKYPDSPAHLANNSILTTQQSWGLQSLPAVFRRGGYRTLALGKITHHPGGLTGKGWAEGPPELPGAWDRSWVPESPWKNPEAMMHGYANGVARRPGQSPPWEAHDGPDEAYPDAWVAAAAVQTLSELAVQPQPWFFAVGFFKPHLPFAAPAKWHALQPESMPDLPAEASTKPAWPSGWHASGEFRGNYGHPNGRDPNVDPAYARQLRRAHAAAVSYVDEQIGRVLHALENSGQASKTIVVIWSDHGLLLGEHGIWGKHCLYELALRSPLMIRVPGMDLPGQISAATVESVDIFPTLTDLCRLPLPEDLDGRSLRGHLEAPLLPAAKPAHSFWTGGQRSTRTERWRLITRPGNDGAAPTLELFDYQTDPGETRNHAADQPETVRRLQALLAAHPGPVRAPRPAK
jgi:iduronate 2-sulfatase